MKVGSESGSAYAHCAQWNLCVPMRSHIHNKMSERFKKLSPITCCGFYSTADLLRVLQKENVPVVHSLWLCSNFSRKSCCDSKFLYLHQFLSGYFLACSLIWTFTSHSSSSPPFFPPSVVLRCPTSVQIAPPQSYKPQTGCRSVSGCQSHSCSSLQFESIRFLCHY